MLCAPGFKTIGLLQFLGLAKKGIVVRDPGVLLWASSVLHILCGVRREYYGCNMGQCATESLVNGFW